MRLGDIPTNDSTAGSSSSKRSHAAIDKEISFSDTDGDDEFDCNTSNDTGFESGIISTPVNNTCMPCESSRSDSGTSSMIVDNGNSVSSAENSDITLVLQQQQAILQQLLDGQKEVEKRQSQLEERLTCLQSKVEQPPSISTPSSSSSDGRRKRVVTRTLSVSFFVFMVYINFCNRIKFISYIKNWRHLLIELSRKYNYIILDIQV